MHYTNQVLLTLRRRAPNAEPKASFDCHKALTPAETTICHSHLLSGWDRSVAAAFQTALKRLPDKQAALRDDQRRWLAKREACGTNAECIDTLQWQRVDELTSQY